MQGARRILITDDSTVITTLLETIISDLGYDTQVAQDGDSCLECIRTFEPDLIFLDLMLPKVHGMEILKYVKSNPNTSKIGVIICTGKALIQDYQEAIISGADYYLVKPLHKETIEDLVKRFFQSSLTPAPLDMTKMSGVEESEEVERFEPVVEKPENYIKLWGTRGSIPVSGLEFHRYGGNTSCMEINHDGDCIIIDAGSGIRELGLELRKKGIKKLHLFIGHTHWDHIMGFPFFLPLYTDGVEVHVYAAKGFKKDIKDLFTGMLDHDYFPVRLDDLRANLKFHNLHDGQPVRIGDVKIHYTYCTHPGATLCFKIETKSITVGYASDNEFLLGYHGHPGKVHKTHSLLVPYRGLINFYQDCPILIHEAQYTPQDYQKRVGWGHSSISNASVLAKFTNAKTWIITHHDPIDTDDDIINKIQIHNKILEECNIGCRCIMAYDGMVLPIP